jgi:hypothetical protein
MDHENDAALLDALDATVEAGRLLTTLAERLLTRAASGERLTDQERGETTNELATARVGLDQATRTGDPNAAETAADVMVGTIAWNNFDRRSFFQLLRRTSLLSGLANQARGSVYTTASVITIK